MGKWGKGIVDDVNHVFHNPWDQWHMDLTDGKDKNRFLDSRLEKIRGNLFNPLNLCAIACRVLGWVRFCWITSAFQSALPDAQKRWKPTQYKQIFPPLYLHYYRLCTQKSISNLRVLPIFFLNFEKPECHAERIEAPAQGQWTNICLSRCFAALSMTLGLW